MGVFFWCIKLDCLYLPHTWILLDVFVYVVPQLYRCTNNIGDPIYLWGTWILLDVFFLHGAQ